MDVKKQKTAQPAAQVKSRPVTPEKKVDFALERENFILMLAGLALIVIGFLLMIGGNSDDPNVFSEEIFSFRRLTLAPLLVLAGYVLEIFAIMKKPRKQSGE